MKKTGFSNSGLFLIEFMIVLLFFSISAAVCVSIFVHAHSLNKESGEKNQALLLAQSAAEQLKASGEDILKEMGAEKIENGAYLFYYDESWKQTEEKSIYCMTIETKTENKLLKVQISIDNGKKEIFNLEVKKYMALETR